MAKGKEWLSREEPLLKPELFTYDREMQNHAWRGGEYGKAVSSTP